MKTTAQVVKIHKENWDTLEVTVSVTHSASASYSRSVKPQAWREFLRFAQTLEGTKILAGYGRKDIEQDSELAGGDTPSLIKYTLKRSV